MDHESPGGSRIYDSQGTSAESAAPSSADYSDSSVSDPRMSYRHDGAGGAGREAPLPSRRDSREGRGDPSRDGGGERRYNSDDLHGGGGPDKRSGPGASPPQQQQQQQQVASQSEQQSRFGFGRQQGSQRNRKGLLGLSNLGNTCFMNAALQCLTHTHGMQKYFRVCSHTYTSRSQSSRQKLLISFAHWFERDWGKGTSAQYHSPEDILRCVQQLNPIFQGYAQQDSQEFLRCVLDNIHEELRREVPDDYSAHLKRRWGIEPELDGQSAAMLHMPRSSQRGLPSEPRKAELAPGGKSSGTVQQTSPTRQLMQLCQSTEGLTDAGEIRLPGPEAAESALKSNNSSSGGGGAFGGSAARFCGSSIATGGADGAGSSTTAGSSSASCVTGASASASSGSATPREDGCRDDDSEMPPCSAGGSEHASSKAARSSSSSSSSSSAPPPKGQEVHYESIVSELFQGRVVSVVRCLDCSRTSRTTEVIYDVSVPIPNERDVGGGQRDLPPPVSQQQLGPRGATWTGMFTGIPGKVKNWFSDKGVEVTDCLRKYCAAELLSGKDKYFCEHCKRKNDCEKRMIFSELPEVLCIHIKRFRYDAGWFNGSKNSKVVTFPVSETLDLSCFLDEAPSQRQEYKLIGLIQHIGSMGGGHYISYCQHKKKPQEWYEFDDLQVTSVNAEQVERAEPYVLFFQRMASKGTELDRQTFKSDQRRVQSELQACLSRTTSPSHARGGMEGADVGIEEMRHQGPALCALYRSTPSELDIVFVSKHWYVRLTTMSHPGPLDNYLYLCPHQLLGSHSAETAAEPFIPISRSLWQSLVQRYGGGPPIGALELCSKCQMHLRAYNERKKAEYDLVSKYDTKDTGEGRYWYLVDALWVNNWKRYVRSEHVTDIADMCAPGPITNARLLEKDKSVPRDKLRLRIDYIGVNARVWWLFMHVHGGGPAICREELDVYSEEASLETDLCLEELAETGRDEYSQRVSREYVDECCGNWELYQQRYHGKGADGRGLKGGEVFPHSSNEAQGGGAAVGEQHPASSTAVYRGGDAIMWDNNSSGGGGGGGGGGGDIHDDSQLHEGRQPQLDGQVQDESPQRGGRTPSSSEKGRSP